MTYLKMFAAIFAFFSYVAVSFCLIVESFLTNPTLGVLAVLLLVSGAPPLFIFLVDKLLGDYL